MKEGRVLSRIIRATQAGWEYEADQRHGEMIIKAMNLQDANPVSSPGEEPSRGMDEAEGEKLEPKIASEYRALAARANFLALDRLDIQFAVKEICRGM